MGIRRVQDVLTVLRGQKLEREAAERREANRRAEATRPRPAAALATSVPRAPAVCPKPAAARGGAVPVAGVAPAADPVRDYEGVLAGLVAAGDAHPGRTIATKYPYLQAAYLRAVNARPATPPPGR